MLKRRHFLGTAAAFLAWLGLPKPGTGKTRTKGTRFPAKPWQMGTRQGHWPLAIASFNGVEAVEKAYTMLLNGSSPVDAAIAGVRILELDPNDYTVGYGGLPNADGVVELDAAVMDGRTSRAGAVGALHRVKTPSAVARVIMERTDHIFLVGEGATRFAKEYGFKLEDLLTPESRKRWLHWREKLSPDDDYLDSDQAAVVHEDPERPTGTIHMSVVNPKGDLAAVTTTSGLFFKIPGRVGDSPIIGAGLFCDDDIGSAGSTGRGEANIKVCGAHTVVEMMRWGMHPKDACLEALRRAVRTTREKRLLDKKGQPNYQLKFYALRKDGTFGAAAMWSSHTAQFAVCDEKGPRLEDCAVLYEKTDG